MRRSLRGRGGSSATTGHRTRSRGTAARAGTLSLALLTALGGSAMAAAPVAVAADQPAGAATAANTFQPKPPIGFPVFDEDEHDHPGDDHEHDDHFHALVFSKTAGFRHDSIEAGVAAIEELGAEHGFHVDHTEDAEDFTEQNLGHYDVVVWLSTTGDVLNEEQQAAFEGYIQDGGGYAGVHAASDTEYDWPWYGELVGAYFDSHPQIQEATTVVTDHVHPSTAHLDEEWVRTDEWYNFQDNPRGDVHVLAALDEDSYDAGSGAMGHDHPIAWCQEFDGGRSWYTGGGHTIESFSEPAFLEHLLGGLRTAAGVAEADCKATVDSSFDQVTLAKGADQAGEPIALAVLPDRSVLHTARDGRVFHTTADGLNQLAGRIPVYSHDEDGLQGIAVDPDFEDNRWVYLYYSPELDTPPGEAPENGTAEDFAPFIGHNTLSRFQLTEDNTLDLDSEQEIIHVEADRGICCHAGGEIDFDSEGNLYLSTGDDTNPFASSNYTPIDIRPDRNPAFDAQRSSANTNDLRGKLLRITVQEDGSYTVPEGNLFEPGTDKTRPEIYAMGFRNPFRFAIDRETDWIYLGDYGPDAGSPDPNRGPEGLVEFNLIKEPGNYGWPYCHGDNQAYNEYDFATGESGPLFDCDNPVNNSPNNTGLTELPPSVPAWIEYSGGSLPAFGSGSESPMGGPTYRYDPELESDTKFPEYYDGKNFAYEWGRGWIKELHHDAEGNLLKINPFFDSMDLVQPMNIEFGPDGSLYVLDYGSEWFGGSDDSALYRIDYTGGERTPVATISASVTSGHAPLTVEFDSAGSVDPAGGELAFEWEFGDGATATGATAEHTYTEEGVYTARLRATNDDERVGTAAVSISVGNTAPVVELNAPVHGGVFAFGERVPFEVTVTDPEDGEIDCSRVVVEYILGHDSHGHPLTRANGCSGLIETPGEGGHGDDANVFGIINASYTDNGAGDLPPLTGSDEVVLQLKNKQAEFFTDSEGVTVLSKEGAGGGRVVGDIHDGDWISVDPVNLHQVDQIGFRIASGGIGGTIEVRVGAPDGELISSVDVANTGGWENFETVGPVDITDPGGTNALYFVFTGDGDEALFDVDIIHFHGDGVADPGAGQPGCEPAEPEEGYRMLFDGTEDSLGGWKQAGPGEFVLQEDCTILSTGGMGLYWFEEEFEAYSLKLDWMMPGDDNSGVFVGFPDPGDDPWLAVNHGYEIQIDPTDEPDRTTGAIYGFQGADLEARDEALNPEGEWNSYEIVVQGQTIKVYLNDVLINDFTSTHPDRDLTSGHIGLQNHGDVDDVFFRNVQIQEIVDSEAPTTSLSTDPAEADGAEGWFLTSPEVTLDASDEGSGVATTEYRIGDGDWTEYTEPFALPGDGVHTVEYRSTDVAGNVEEPGTAELRVDTTAPLTTADFADPNEAGWHDADVVVELAAEDGTSGVARVEWTLDGEDWAEYTEPVQVSGDGEHTLRYRAVDVAGNVEADKAATIMIDATAPTLLVSGVANGVVYGNATDLVLSWHAEDETSGIDSVSGTLNGEAVLSGRVLPLYQLALGTHTLSVSATDNAGNTAEQSLVFATTTSLRDVGQLVDRFRLTNRLSLSGHAALAGQLTAARIAEATGDELGAINELREFVALAGDAELVRDAEVRSVLVRDAEAIIASIEGVAVLDMAVNAVDRD